MKIVVLGMRGFPHVQGGIEKHCEELYPRLVRLGCDVTVITRTPYISKHKRVDEWKGVKFAYRWSPRHKSLEALTHTFLNINRLRNMKPDILHIHAIGPSLFLPLAKIWGLNVVMTHHGPEYERAKWGIIAKRILKYGEKNGVLHSNAIIAVSTIIKDLISRKYNKEAVFIPNGVGNPIIVPPGKTIKKWGLEPKKYVFTACRFVPEKGLHDLLNAYMLIDSPSFKLVIAGDADHETEYSKQIKKTANERDRIILTGFVSGEELGELFTNAGLFVLPSYYEGLPIVLLEALSYGLPVLVSDIAQHKQIALHNSRYFKTGDVLNLSRALERGISNHISEVEINEYLSMINTKYNWDTIAAETFSVYKKVLGYS